MRRTKSDALHPASRVIAASLSQYEDPEEDRVDYDGGGPEKSLWHDLPILPLTETWCIVKKYNFYRPADVDITTIWRQFKDEVGATEPSIAGGLGGGMKFQTGDEMSFSYNYIYEEKGIFSFKPGQTTWIEWDVKLGNRGQLVVGFGETFTVDEFPGLGIEPVKPKNGFNISTAGVMRVYNDGQMTPYLDEVAITDAVYDEFQKTGMRIEPSVADPDKFDIYVFFDGEYQGRFEEIELSSELVGIYFGNYYHESTVTVRNVIVIQEKDID